MPDNIIQDNIRVKLFLNKITSFRKPEVHFLSHMLREKENLRGKSNFGIELNDQTKIKNNKGKNHPFLAHSA